VTFEDFIDNLFFVGCERERLTDGFIF
jgi:hypothetical protein